MVRIAIVFTVILTILLSCNNDNVLRKSLSDMTEFEAKIVIPAGDLMPSFDNIQMPTFFNIGTIISDPELKVPTIVLGQRVDKGKRLDIRNLGLISFERDTTEITYILSYADDFSSEELDFERFMVQNNDVVQSIESWFKGQCGLGNCKNFKWNNGYQAYLKLYDKQLKN